MSAIDDDDGGSIAASQPNGPWAWPWPVDPVRVNPKLSPRRSVAALGAQPSPHVPLRRPPRDLWSMEALGRVDAQPSGTVSRLPPSQSRLPSLDRPQGRGKGLGRPPVPPRYNPQPPLCPSSSSTVMYNRSVRLDTITSWRCIGANDEGSFIISILEAAPSTHTSTVDRSLLPHHSYRHRRYTWCLPSAIPPSLLVILTERTPASSRPLFPHSRDVLRFAFR